MVPADDWRMEIMHRGEHREQHFLSAGGTACPRGMNKLLGDEYVRGIYKVYLIEKTSGSPGRAPLDIAEISVQQQME